MAEACVDADHEARTGQKLQLTFAASGLLREDATTAREDLRLRLLAEGEIQQAERWAPVVRASGAKL